MTIHKPQSYVARTVVTGLLALVLWAIFFLGPPLAAGRDATLFGLPLRVALALPIALPAFVLIMFWFAARQNIEDERFRDD